jgi:SNF2 family DNA or RNA helicase
MIIDSFQNLEIDVLICTYGVGATGLTLTASHTVMLLDRPWTPGDVMQVIDLTTCSITMALSCLIKNI